MVCVCFMGALGGGQMGNQLRILRAEEPDPAGAAGGKLGQGSVFRMGQPLHQLVGLLHNGQVGGEGGVEHMGNPQGPDSGGQPLFRCLLRGEPKTFAPGSPDGRGDLENHFLLGVGQGGKDLFRVIPLPESAHRAVGHALAAEGAGGFVHPQALADPDGGVGPGAGDLPHPQGLNPLADGDAPQALDALGAVPEDGQGVVPGPLRGGLSKGDGLDVHVLGELLQGAVAAAHAGDAVVHVLGEDQLHVGLAGDPHPLGVGVDHHALFHQGVAGGGQLVHPFHLHGADAAGAHLVDLPQVAEGGDADVRLPGGVQDGGAGGHSDGLVVDGQGHHAAFLPPLKPAWP